MAQMYVAFLLHSKFATNYFHCAMLISATNSMLTRVSLWKNYFKRMSICRNSGTTRKTFAS